MKFLFAFALFAVVAYVSANPLYGGGVVGPIGPIGPIGPVGSIYGGGYNAPLRVPLYNAPRPSSSAAAAAAAAASSSTGVRSGLGYRNLAVPSYGIDGLGLGLGGIY